MITSFSPSPSLSFCVCSSFSPFLPSSVEGIKQNLAQQQQMGKFLKDIPMKPDHLVPRDPSRSLLLSCEHLNMGSG